MKKTFLFPLFLFAALLISASSPTEEETSDKIFYEIQEFLKTGHCFSISLTASIVRNDGRTASTKYGVGELRSRDYRSDRILAVFRQVSLSSRNFFAGKKDVQTVEFLLDGNRVYIKTILNSWNNDVFYLQDVRVNKDGLGYYFTGRTTGSNGTTHYIFSVYNRYQCVTNQGSSVGVRVRSGRCNLQPDAGNCKANVTKYYYDSQTGKCRTFTWGGCGGVVPFNTLEECRNACGG